MPIQYTDTKHMQKKTTLPRPLTEDTHTNTESFKIFYAYFYSAISGNNNEHYKYMWKTFFGNWTSYTILLRTWGSDTQVKL